MKFRAKTNDKREIEIQWQQVNTYLSKWPPGTVLDVEIVRRQSRKSDPMRKLYFATILPQFAGHLGYDPDEYLLFHRQLKIVYFQVQPDDKGIYRKVPHVFANESTLSVGKKKRFMDWVERKASMEGCYIEI